MRRLAMLLAVLSFLTGSPAFIAGPALPPIVIAGCEIWRTGQVCMPGKDGLKIWVPGEPASLLVDGRPHAAAPQDRLGGGYLYEIVSLAGASRLSVVTAAGRYELTLTASDRPAWYDGIKYKMDHDQKVEAEKELNALTRLNPRDNAYKLYLLARLQSLRADKASLAVMAAKQWGDSSAAVRDLVYAAQLFHEEGDYARRDLSLRDARLIAQRLRSAEIVPFLPFYYLHNLEAYFAIDRGDLRGALDQLDALQDFDQRGVFEKWEHHAWKDEQHALVLIELGRFEEAGNLLQKLLEEAPAGDGNRAGTRAEVLVNRGWAAYLAREAGRPAPDPLPFFEESWTLQHDSPDDGIRFGCKLNLAAANLQAGRPEAAARYLEEAAAFQAGASVVHKFQARELGARLLLQQGKAAEAHQKFFELDRDASALRLPALRWMALLGRAEAAVKLGRGAEALAALEVAAQLGNSELLLIPANKGRETFLARRDRATRLEIELMLDQGDAAQAWKTFFWRLTQTQRLLQNDEILAGFDEKQRARRDSLLARYRENVDGLAAEDTRSDESPAKKVKLQQTRLAERKADLDSIRDSLFDQLGSTASPRILEIEPAPGELLLGFFPLENGWVGLARNQDGVLVRQLRSAASSRTEVARGLLTLFRKEIAAATRIKIFPWGDLNEVEFHLLESSKPVIYGVAAGRGRAPFSPLEKALLVENPMKDLRSAVAEIRLVRKTLEERSPGIELIVPLTENATPAAISQDLEKADFLHFAGHSAAGKGYGGFEGTLALRHGDLPLSDLFALRRVPRLVVLSSCEAGLDLDHLSREKGLGLAQAFVLAGADQVLAATRAVDDIKTARLMEEIYRRWPASDKEIDLAVLLFEARTSLRQTEPDPTWDAFRVFEP